jgi:outer membrane cobalamin receptor
LYFVFVCIPACGFTSEVFFVDSSHTFTKYEALDQDPDSLHTLPKVEIDGFPKQTIVPAQTLLGKALQHLENKSVSDAIRFFSGVQVKDYGGVGGVKTIDVRGMGSKHTSIFYDGVSINNAQNGTVDLGKFSLENIEMISLYNGQKSEILQSARDYNSSSSIYLRTKTPIFSNNNKTNLSVKFRAGSFSLLNGSVLWEQKIFKDISSSLNAEYIYSSGKYKFTKKRFSTSGILQWDTTAYRQNSDINALRVEGGFNGAFGGSTNGNSFGKWQVKGYYYQSNRGVPGPVRNNVFNSSARQWDRNGFIQTSLDGSVNNLYSYSVKVKYANDFLRYADYDPQTVQIDNSFWQQNIYTSLANKFSAFKWWDISFATDFTASFLKTNRRDMTISPQRFEGLAALSNHFYFNSAKIQASVLNTTIKSSGQKIINKFTPSIYISYTPFKDLLFYAFNKTVYRMPSFDELYYSDMQIPALKPEKSIQTEIGVQYEKQWEYVFFKLKTEGYYNFIDNKIVLIPRGNSLYRWMVTNIGKVQMGGIDVAGDISFKWENSLYVSALATYSFERAMDYSDPSNDRIYKKQIAYTPFNTFSVRSEIGYKWFSFSYQCMYVGERYENSENIESNRIDALSLHDISFLFDFGKIKLLHPVVMFEINNIFNKQYEIVKNYPMSGINFSLTLRLGISI